MSILDKDLPFKNCVENKFIDEKGQIIVEKIYYIEVNKPQSEASKQAYKKYFDKNKEKITENLKQYKKDRYKNDPEYRQHILDLKKQSYNRKKLEKQQELNI